MEREVGGGNEKKKKMLELSNLIQILSLANLGDLQESLMTFILAIPYLCVCVCVCVCVCMVCEIVWYVSVSRSVEIYLKTNLLSCVFNK